MKFLPGFWLHITMIKLNRTFSKAEVEAFNPIYFHASRDRDFFSDLLTKKCKTLKQAMVSAYSVLKEAKNKAWKNMVDSEDEKPMSWGGRVLLLGGDTYPELLLQHGRKIQLPFSIDLSSRTDNCCVCRQNSEDHPQHTSVHMHPFGFCHMRSLLRNILSLDCSLWSVWSLGFTS